MDSLLNLIIESNFDEFSLRKYLNKTYEKEKCYIINISDFYEHYLYDPEIVFAKNASEAKTKLFKLYKENYNLPMMMTTDEEMTYLDVRVNRRGSYDRYLIGDEKYNLFELFELVDKIKENNENNIILNDPNITHCFLIKRGSYYMDNYCGYTSHILRAGMYPKEDAIKHIGHGVSLRPINNREHFELINKEIQRLNNNLKKTIL